MLVAGTAAGLVLLVQSPAAGLVVATAGAVLLGLGVPAVAARVRRRPEGFLPTAVIHEPVVVRSALAASAVPAAWFALLIAVPAVLAAEGWTPLQVGLALVPSAITRFLAPRLAGPLLARPRPPPVAGHLRDHRPPSRPPSPRSGRPSDRRRCWSPPSSW